MAASRFIGVNSRSRSLVVRAKSTDFERWKPGAPLEWRTFFVYDFDAILEVSEPWIYGKLNKAFLHFLPNFWHFWWFFQVRRENDSLQDKLKDMQRRLNMLDSDKKDLERKIVIMNSKSSNSNDQVDHHIRSQIPLLGGRTPTPKGNRC